MNISEERIYYVFKKKTADFRNYHSNYCSCYGCNHNCTVYFYVGRNYTAKYHLNVMADILLAEGVEYAHWKGEGEHFKTLSPKTTA